ncbi:MAG: hypothetical protein Ct9H300mP12_13070 [Acidimicrobiales bacterium]|nr:MAG: hypothetical protein Ct9H300mP12_13070 [Acidimicrobiales bacterium]
MPELTIGMPLPFFATDYAGPPVQATLARATLGQMYDPKTAVDVGFLDETVDGGDALDVAVARAPGGRGGRTWCLERTRVTPRGL